MCICLVKKSVVDKTRPQIIEDRRRKRVAKLSEVLPFSSLAAMVYGVDSFEAVANAHNCSSTYAMIVIFEENRVNVAVEPRREVNVTTRHGTRNY